MAEKQKALSMETLKGVHAAGKRALSKREQAEIDSKKGSRTTKEQKAPIMPIKAQTTGQIRKGPPAYIVCAICTRMFGRPTGTRKRHAAKHLADHRMGRIRKPVAPEAKEEK